MTEEMSRKFFQVIQEEETLKALLEIRDMDHFVLKSDHFVLRSLVDLRCEDSLASVKEDHDRVFKAIERSIGFALLNSMVLHVMEQWFERELQKQIEADSVDKAKVLNVLEHVRMECLKRRLKMTGVGEEHPDTLRSRYAIAELLKQQGKHDQALEMHTACLYSRRKVLEHDHPDTKKSEEAVKFLQEQTQSP
jgi:hypothetical protein